MLGAMLPDLAAIAGLRAASLPGGSPLLGRGVRFHGACDAAFHVAPAFLRLLALGRAALEGDGLAPGRARAAAHVGVELLLDGWLAAQAPPSAVYRAAIRLGRTGGAALAWRAGGDPARLARVCERLAEGELPAAYADPERAALAVERTLARRARLALGGGEGRAVARALAALRAPVAESGPALLGPS